MLRRDQCIFLSLLLSHIALILSDKPNADVIARQSGGKIVSTAPGTGDSVSYTPSNTGGFIPVYEGQQPPSSSRLNPTSLGSNKTNNGPGNSSIGGVLRFLYNLGRTSEKDKRRADVETQLRKEELATRYTDNRVIGRNGGGTVPVSKECVEQVMAQQAASDAIRLAREVEKEQQLVKAEAIVSQVTNTPEPKESPAISNENIVKILSTSEPKGPTLLPANPLKELNDKNSGGGSTAVGTLKTMVGIGAVVGQTVSTPAAATAAGGSGASTVAITTALVGTLGTAATVVSVGVVAGVALGYALIPIIDGIFYPGIGWWPSDEKRRAYHINRAALKASKIPSSIPQYKASNNTPTPADNPNTKKPEDDKNKHKAAKNSRKQMLEKTRSLTNKEARELVKNKLPGYDEKPNPPFKTQGNTAFYNPKTKTWISADQDCHNGGVWKLFDRAGNRKGTYNSLLNIRIKD